MEDNEGEWSYSTGPGATTLDVLRERFGDTSFRDAPSWQPWVVGVDASAAWQGGGSLPPPAGMDTRFHLASPKL